jgi:hypothetical protein
MRLPWQPGELRSWPLRLPKLAKLRLDQVHQNLFLTEVDSDLSPGRNQKFWPQENTPVVG